MCAASVVSAFKNFFRAGTLKNKSRTSMLVPTGQPIALGSCCSPPSTRTSVPSAAPASQVNIVKRATLAILGSASPRNPNVMMLA
ncbi:hypothetical protein N9904_03780, partial [Akkermansiaceae bacterium]|nr:hypothetical protein [Akkermansiaceae bacterium]